MNITVVIPAYNEAKRIGAVLDALRKYKLPIIVVDDGSLDQTYQEAQKANVITLRHKINLGKGAALKTGCEAAFMNGAEAIIMMDSDGQHQVSDLPKFIEKISSGNYDIVFGSRNYDLGVPLVRFIGNKLASVMVSLSFGIYVSDLICGFRAFTKVGYAKLNWSSLGYGVETEMVIRAGKNKLNRCEVPVEAIYYEKFKGVTILDALAIFFHVLRWRIKL
ncbi:glycosyltransferase family 2 protein [Patescibacteria group bacterium]|nr:glycosyltransferase family 2 protein [Patescibacteria group bacterium]MCL5409295.1 glycosyltransferase family 2 protein [Patescibacteria group bacterium]